MRTSLVEASDEKGPLLVEIRRQYGLQFDVKIELKKCLTFEKENVEYAPLSRVAMTASADSQHGIWQENYRWVVDSDAGQSHNCPSLLHGKQSCSLTSEIR